MTENSKKQIDRDTVDLAILRNNKEERRASDKKYAMKLAEKVVFGLVGLLLTAIVIALLSNINL